VNGLNFARTECAIVAGDIARARSTLIALRTKIDLKGHDKVFAYGQALLHVASLIASTVDVDEKSALKARGMSAAELDRIYRDLFSSAKRCRSFSDPGTPGHEMAENLATACSILKNLYRMRFHEEKASGPQQLEAGDLAERFMTLSAALTQMGIEAAPSRQLGPIAIAA
jgi:hypothetical protein